ncbi:hypothetical protein LEMLEM_LOCUS6893 [Lemmus lemmus]
MQVNGMKTINTHTEAIKALKKPKEVQPKLPKDPNHKFHCFAFAHTKLVNQILLDGQRSQPLS